MIKEKSLIKAIRFLLCSAIIAFVCAAITSNIGYPIDIADADSSASADSYQLTAEIYEAGNYNSDEHLLTSQYGSENKSYSTNYGYVSFGSKNSATQLFAGSKYNTSTKTSNTSAAIAWTAPSDVTLGESEWCVKVQSISGYGAKVAFVKGSIDENGTTTLTSMITGESFGDYAFDGFWITVPQATTDSQLGFSSYIKGVRLEKGEFLMVIGNGLVANKAADRIRIDSDSSAKIIIEGETESQQINRTNLNNAYIEHFNNTEEETTNIADISVNNWSYKFVKLLNDHLVVVKVNDVENSRHVAYEDLDFTLPSAPAVEGKVFIGWDIGDNTLKNAGDKISVTKDITINAVFVDFSTEEDAYFRLVKDSTGIRFVAKVKTADITDLVKYGTVTFGMKIGSNTSGLENGGLNMAVLSDNIISGEEYSKFHCAIVNFFKSTEGAFEDIDLYNAEFVATAYVTINTTDGTVVTADTNSSNAKSVAKMANAALNDYKTETDDTYAYSVEGYENQYWKFNYSKDELDVIKGFADKYVDSQENA